MRRYCTFLLVASVICCHPVDAARHSIFLGARAGHDDEASSSIQGSLHHRAGASAVGHTSGPANVLIKYIVPPPAQQEFIEIFQGVKEETIAEAGCVEYYLLKPITDNVSFYVLGRWRTKDAYTAHFQAAYTKRLLEFDQEKGIVFYIQPLLVVD